MIKEKKMNVCSVMKTKLDKSAIYVAPSKQMLKTMTTGSIGLCEEIDRKEGCPDSLSMA